jgi:hypothetical protein
MARLDAAQKQWLTDLGVIVGDAATEAPDQPPRRNDKTGAPAATTGADALAAWKAGRTAALNSLKAVAGKVAGAKHEKSAGAIVEIQGVVNKLTAEPTTLPQVIELQRYLGSDDIVNDVCELVEDIRTPLLGALGRMQTALAA